MFKTIFKKIRKAISPLNKLVFSPVYYDKLLGVLYQKGEILPHARMKVIYEDMSILVGVYFKGNKKVYFVVTDIEIINHIHYVGAVPLIQNNLLHIFTDKKEMQLYVRRYNSSVSA